MGFSERYGYGETSNNLERGRISVKLKTRIWNILYSEIFNKLDSYPRNERVWGFVRKAWDHVFKLNIRKFENNVAKYHYAEAVNEVFSDRLKWNEVFDLIEFSINELNSEKLAEQLNKVLKEEGSAYRIVNKQVVEITAEEEIKEIERVFNQSAKLDPIKAHLDKALKYLSNREKPDYDNSIKESISALESLARIISGQKSTLGDLIKKFNIHPALKEAIEKLYGWASDDGGIRHGSDGKGYNPDEEEARLILILSSALINYIVAKSA